MCNPQNYLSVLHLCGGVAEDCNGFRPPHAVCAVYTAMDTGRCMLFAVNANTMVSQAGFLPGDLSMFLHPVAARRSPRQRLHTYQ
jgi:hypothetical protein